MKLTKDTLIEGVIVKKGTSVNIKESNQRASVNRYYSLVDELKTLPRSDYSRGSVLEKEKMNKQEELRVRFENYFSRRDLRRNASH